ncbi:uncharacterized protein LOC131694997 [Topomyia yanbarensis]|uniref:uncharacterized protein LOC131694997 n=1 Tax=Topomyia yanbarensis TaxID=2498891 RepID=UPI00273C2F24|nr:uncharacterized protein LOC131694997 [Topomyia yanbarensis]
MPNVGGPKSSTRRLLASVIDTVIWVSGRGRSSENQAQPRKAVQDVLADGLMSRETIQNNTVGDSMRYRRDDPQLHHFGGGYRVLQLKKCQKRENRFGGKVAAGMGQFGYRLILNLLMWFNRNHIEINFHLTQRLSSHGFIRRYLHQFGTGNVTVVPEV